jgi:glycosyltransferase involved in cell wall biosynthesis
MKIAVLMLNPVHYFVPLYKELSKKSGWDLTIFYTSRINISNEKEPESNKSIDWGGENSLLNGYNYVFLKKVFPNLKHGSFLGHFNPGIIPAILKYRPDVIIIHGYAYLTSWIAMAISKLLKVKVIMKGEINELQERSRFKNIIRKPIVKMIFGTCDHFFAIGTLNKNYYLNSGIPENKISMVPFCVNNDFFFSQFDKLKENQKNIKKKYGISDNAFVIISVGKLIGRKRHEDILNAVSLLSRNSTKEYHILLVGDGPEKCNLQSCADEKKLTNITITGFVKQDQLSEFYSVSDVFILCSQKETWGLVVNEAMCHALPVILSDKVGCVPDLVSESNGFVYPCGNVELLAECIQKISNNKYLKLLGLESRKIISNWGWNEAVQGMITGINRLL